MKIWIMTLGLALSMTAGAQTLPIQKQKEILDQTGKQIRRSYYQRGYVIEGYELAGPETSKTWSEFVKLDNPGAEEPLDKTQIASLTKCVKSEGACKLYRAILTMNYMGGTGVVYHWLSFSPKSGKISETIQTIYSE